MNIKHSNIIMCKIAILNTNVEYLDFETCNTFAIHVNLRISKTKFVRREMYKLAKVLVEAYCPSFLSP